MSAAVGVGLVALQILAGLFLARRLGRAGEPWWARASLAFALGGAVIGLAQVALSALGFAAGLGVPVGIAVVSVLAARLPRQPASTPASTAASTAAASTPLPATDGLDRHARRVLLGLTLVVGLVGASASAGLPFRSDGSKFWAPRARELATAGALEVPALVDEYRVAFHRTYPLLVPTLLAPAFAHSSPDAMVGAKVVLAAYHLALLGLVAAALLRCGPRGGWVLLAFLGSPLLMRTEIRESVVAGGFVDEVVAVYLLLLVMTVERLRGAVARDGGTGAVLLAVLVGAALVATKLEGALALACVLVAVLLAGPRGRGKMLVVCGGVLLLSVPTLWIRGGVIPDEPIVSWAGLVDPASLGARFVPVLYEVFATLLDASALGLLPLLVVVVLTGLPGRGRAYPRLLLLGLLGFLVLVYLGTTMDVARHVHTSAHRLLFQWMPALALLAARALQRAREDDVAASPEAAGG